MSTIKLDEIDQQIIDLLLKNSRIPISDISQNLMISKDIIKLRIDKLIESKIISYFTIGLNSEYISSHPYYIIIIETTFLKTDNCIQEFYKSDEIREIHELLQYSRLLLITNFLPIKDFHKLLERLRNNPSIKTIESWPVTRSYKIGPIVLNKPEMNTCTNYNQ